MRTFTSYGPLDTELNYYVPRSDLIDLAYERLVGKDTGKTGHYITIWAPRQTGKTWVIQQVVRKIKKSGSFDVAMFSMEFVKEQRSESIVLKHFVQSLEQQTGKTFPVVENWNDLAALFTRTYFQRPVILVLDEFDSWKMNSLTVLLIYSEGYIFPVPVNRTKKAMKKATYCTALH